MAKSDDTQVPGAVCQEERKEGERKEREGEEREEEKEVMNNSYLLMYIYNNLSCITQQHVFCNSKHLTSCTPAIGN